ncbi:S41 family peptidase [Luteimonas kalidii]|uniref:S41 family peptidase n=1 Tax=Luteimonas kalidii TaxID=3042025 RepID=A0ABT6JX91_9GAMM|nr:S41 family peptidase [Luteimonas kalidii]MDH5835095.1 S41 family peptidase [Luteimonas kalidii]
MRRVLLCFAALLWLPAVVLAAEPRVVGAQVADIIEREYFDPARAASIAAGLRSAAARGEFDAATNPQELASALTSALKPHDGHFNVRWQEGEGAGAAPRPRPPFDPARGNFGIRQVQVLPGNVGYLDLRLFADFEPDQADAPARRAIDAALQLLAHVDALVIDLRDNGGGSPAMVGYLASAFLAPGREVYNTFRSRAGTESEAPARPYAAPRTTLPLYLLVSGRTGSAAEAFAYTLEHAGRATLVGEASGGAANPGRPFALDDGFSVFVSTGSPVNPVTGGNWEGVGVAPDMPVDSAQALEAATNLAWESLLARGAGDDVRWALEASTATPTVLAPEALAAFAGDYGAVRIEPAGAGLQLRQGRRPPLRLRPLSDVLFTVEGEPARRVRFEREGPRVTALELLWADGQVARHARLAASGTQAATD